MTDRRHDPFLEDEENLENGVIPRLDLQLGGDVEASGEGDDGLASLDEENLYGNDVSVDGEFEDRLLRGPAEPI